MCELTPTIMGLVKYLYRAQLLRPHAHEQPLSQPARIGLHDFKYMNVGFSVLALGWVWGYSTLDKLFVIISG